MNAFQEWYMNADQYDHVHAQGLQECIIEQGFFNAICLLVQMYELQNEHIGEFARQYCPSEFSLAQMEELWITHSSGRALFFTRYEADHASEWNELRTYRDEFNTCYLLFQTLWLFNPTHAYLLRLHVGGRSLSLADFCTRNDEVHENALNRLRLRFKPLFKEETT